MTRRQWSIVAGVLGALLLGAFAYLSWWDRYVGDGLANWAVDEVGRRTENAYRLNLGHLDFHPLIGYFSFDSAVVTTDTAANQHRAVPLPDLQVRATGCRIAGVHVLRLALQHRFDAGHMGCSSVAAAIQLQQLAQEVADRPDTIDERGPSAPRRPPLGITRFDIADIAFPTMAFSLRRPGPRGEWSVSLERARLAAELVEFDPLAPLGEHSALHSKGVRFDASQFVLRPDTLSEFAIGAIDAGITDSTFRLDSIVYAPRLAGDAWTRAQRRRHDRIAFSLQTFAGRGVAYRTLLRTGDVHIRALELTGAQLDVLSDKRLPPGPKGRYSTPQQAAQRSKPAVRVDTLLIRQSQITYQERKKDRPRAGQITFAQLDCRIVHVDVPSKGIPLTVDASTRLMNQGTLLVHITVPLDAPNFQFDLTGRLGPMPVAAFNGFLQETTPVRIKGGQADSIVFSIHTSGGIAKGKATPLYRDLAIDFSSGGVLGFVKAGVVEFAANKFKVRSNNPDEKGKKPTIGTSSRSYDPSNSWISFLWMGVRDPLLKAVVK
ncbi:MAG TPA: DUF748 domain-containing protein [Gemmatimonadaceae bacterium]|nr:DUF748 domain-containing protein [Gemmatimonadaceae bacterium]HUL50927.1 DUF748 domain-containing protein [Gemmatimonadales bacterium]